MNITEEEFKSYVRVQRSGVTNMFDANRVQSLSGLTREKIMEIMKTYGQLSEQFKKVVG